MLLGYQVSSQITHQAISTECLAPDTVCPVSLKGFTDFLLKETTERNIYRKKFSKNYICKQSFKFQMELMNTKKKAIYFTFHLGIYHH